MELSRDRDLELVHGLWLISQVGVAILHIRSILSRISAHKGITAVSDCALDGAAEYEKNALRRKVSVSMTTASYPYAPESMDATLAEFLRRWPAYEQTRSLDELRATEYARLDALDQVYLDYTGGGLYAESQLREHMALLSQRCLRQSPFDQSHLAGGDGTGRACARVRARLLQRLARRVLRCLHAERQRGAEAGRRGVSVRAGRPVSADLR